MRIMVAKLNEIIQAKENTWKGKRHIVRIQ